MKTEREWEVQGDYDQGWELVTGNTTRRGILQDLRAHRDNEPGIPFRIRTPEQIKARERSRMRRANAKEARHAQQHVS